MGGGCVDYLQKVILPKMFVIVIMLYDITHKKGKIWKDLLYFL